MNVSSWFCVLAYFVFTMGIGKLLIKSFGFRSRDGLVQSWASCYLVGQVVLTLFTLSTTFIPWRIGFIQYGLLVCLAVYGLYRLTHFQGISRLLRAVVFLSGFVCLLVLIFPSAYIVAQNVPLWEWDARSNWFFHGKSIFVAGGIDATFFTNPLYEWSHHDYPLLIPIQSAWSALFSGKWDDYTNKAFLLFDFAAYFYIFCKTLCFRRYPWWLAGFIGVVVFDRESYSYVSGYADNHYTIAIMLALLVMASVELIEGLPMVLLLLSFAAATKNEGMLYAGLIVVLILIVALRHWRFSGLMEFLVRQKRIVLWFLLVGILPTAFWQVFRLAHHVQNDLHLGTRLGDIGLMSQLLRQRGVTVAVFIGDFYITKGALYLVALILMLKLWRCRNSLRYAAVWSKNQAHERLAWIVFAVAQAFVFVVYVATPQEIDFHLSTSATRLQFFPFMLLLLIGLYNADALLQGILPDGEISEAAH